MKLQKLIKSNKKEREKKILIGLINQYLSTGQPVGSGSLKDAEFDEISSATIRNYFAELENEGFLKQLHTSGGRIPTEKAYRLYAEEFYDFTSISKEEEEVFSKLKGHEAKQISLYLQQAAETLSSLTHFAVFLSAPRFDHDFIVDFKLVLVDSYRFLSVIITDFGIIQTELLHSDQKLSSSSIKKIETYFRFRLSGSDKPVDLAEEEEKLAIKFYNELMLRYIVGYSNFIEEEIYRTGFSKLLHYPDFHDTTTLANSLALFENAHSMRMLLRECSSHDALKYWIGDDLATFGTGKQHCSVLAIPYRINKQIVGAIGVLGPIRMPYKELFALMKAFSDSVSEALTRSIYKFKISFRQPERGASYLQKEEHHFIGQSRLMLLEDKHTHNEDAHE